MLDRNVELGVDAAPVTAGDGIDTPAPQVDDIGAHRIQIRDGNAGEHALTDLSLQRDGTSRTAIGKLEGRRAGQIRINLADCAHWISERQVFDLQTILDRVDEELCHPDFQRSSRLGDIRIADNDVHASVCTGISQGLVARVNNWTRARGRRGHSVPHLIGALGELEPRRCRSGVDPPVTDQDLARHEECDKRIGDLTEVAAPMEEIVFVAAVGVALRVQVVAEQVQVQV